MKPAYIISARIADKHREKAIHYIIEQVLTHHDFEIIIIEQDNKPKLSLDHLSVKHIFVENKGGFDKAWGYNIAYSNTVSDKLIFADADLYLHSEHLKNCVNLLDKHEVLDPKDFIWALDKKQTNVFTKTNILPRRRDVEIRGHVTVCGGVVLFQREALEKIGGWTELCRGWGAEDDIQAYKVNRFLKPFHFSGQCIHLYHPSAEPETEIGNEDYQNNLKVLDQYKSEVKDLEDIFELEPEKRGDIYKYATSVEA